MEFFQIVDVSTNETAIQQDLTLRKLEAYCESIFPLDENPEVCLTGGMWGEFTVRRDLNQPEILAGPELDFICAYHAENG